MCRLFPCIPIFRGFFLLKSVKRMCICDYAKNRIGTCGKCIFWFEKRYKSIIALGSPKTYCLYFQLHKWNTLMENTLDPKGWDGD